MAQTKNTEQDEKAAPDEAEALRAEIAELRRQLEEKAAKKAAPKQKTPGAGDELVPVYLFRDSGRYKDDVFVAVNGETCRIKRGVQVMVKKKFADVLEASREQDNSTANLMDEMASDFRAESARLGVN